jgi:hypothetical protein
MRLEAIHPITGPNTGDPIIIAEMSVVEGMVGAVVVAPGTIFGCSFNLAPRNKYGAGDCQKLLVALIGKRPGNETDLAELVTAGAFSPEARTEIFGERQILRGRTVAVETAEKHTRCGPNANNPQGVVTSFFWSPCPQ